MASYNSISENNFQKNLDANGNVCLPVLEPPVNSVKRMRTENVTPLMSHSIWNTYHTNNIDYSRYNTQSQSLFHNNYDPYIPENRFSYNYHPQREAQNFQNPAYYYGSVFNVQEHGLTNDTSSFPYPLAENPLNYIGTNYYQSQGQVVSNVSHFNSQMNVAGDMRSNFSANELVNATYPSFISVPRHTVVGQVRYDGSSTRNSGSTGPSHGNLNSSAHITSSNREIAPRGPSAVIIRPRRNNDSSLTAGYLSSINLVDEEEETAADFIKDLDITLPSEMLTLCENIEKGKNIHRYKCPLCTLEFHQKGGVRQHLSAVHFKIKRFGCAFTNCDKTYAAKGDLTRHINNVHLEKRLFICLCGNTYTRKMCLRRHLLKYHCHLRRN